MRLTRVKDEYECRVNGCPAEDWMRDLYDEYPYGDICEHCPFEKYINKLAEIEDKEEFNCGVAERRIDGKNQN